MLLQRCIRLLTIAFWAAPLLVACGGGGGGATGQTPTDSSLSASKYSGTYSSNCEIVPDGRVVETGAQLYVRTYETIAPTSNASAHVTLRFDFFDSPDCSPASTLGSLVNNNPSNKVTVVGTFQIEDFTAEKVEISIGLASSISPAQATTRIDAVYDFEIPSILLGPFVYKDLWLLVDGLRYEGAEPSQPGGFPTELLAETLSFRSDGASPLQSRPCPAQTVTWGSTAAGSCSGSMDRARSAARVYVNNTAADRWGQKSMSCVNGEWTTAEQGSCSSSEIPPSTPLCPAQTVTWTVNSVTCQGTMPAMYRGWTSFGFASGTNQGQGYFMCTDGGFVPYSGLQCTAPPATVSYTDPMEIHTRKNCAACHTLTGSGGAFPSYQTIADFYRGNTPSAGTLEHKIYYGGNGTFGAIPMPSNTQITTSELAIIVPWILNR